MGSSQILTLGTRPIGGCDGEFSDSHLGTRPIGGCDGEFPDSHCGYSVYRWM